MPSAIYLTADIRRIEEAAGSVAPGLMERAGRAAAELAARIALDKDILVLAGPGNNGGDAYEVAAHLREQFFRVAVVSIADADSLAGDARAAMLKWRSAGGEILGAVPVDRNWGLVVDGLFGIGLAREISGDYAKLIAYANSQPCPRLALDIPSGIESDTGRVLGSAIRATHCLTFIALKPGLLTLDGPDYCGEVSVADLGLGATALLAPRGWVAGRDCFAEKLKPRPRNFHKGMAGSVCVLGGAAGMTGAALLAARAALKLGAGRVYVGLLDHQAPSVDSGALELMLRHPDEALGMDLDAIVIGPGLGQGERGEALVAAALASEIPCVLDADALNLIAANEDLRRACTTRKAESLLTPHPGEASRLLVIGTGQVQADRLGATRRIAAQFSGCALLKGNGSIIATPDGRWYVNSTGNPGMASAGMGDVLSGVLGALLAQGHSAESAAVIGAHLHGLAADHTAREVGGPLGITASETIAAARRIHNAWRAA
jgi:hydroxyethylthiazole kinase-like uncharacterized protein yjeF